MDRWMYGWLFGYSTPERGVPGAYRGQCLPNIGKNHWANISIECFASDICQFFPDITAADVIPTLGQHWLPMLKIVHRRAIFADMGPA